jgi:hypothetical protein
VDLLLAYGLLLNAGHASQALLPIMDLLGARGAGLADARDKFVDRLTHSCPDESVYLVDSGHVRSTRLAHGGAGDTLMRN